MPLAPEVLRLNLIAQEIVPWDEAVRWFDGVDDPAKKKILDELTFICHAAHPRKEEVDPAIRLAGLKDTFTPCVIVKKARTPERGFHTLKTLPEDEWKKTFLLLLALFSLADKRRRATVCRNGCSHEWHNLKNA